MTTNLSRFGMLTFALLGILATASVRGAMAQAAIPQGGADGVIGTTCGPGTETSCGTRDVMQCEWSFDIQLGFLTRSAEFSIFRKTCIKTGTITVYKDKDVNDIIRQCTVGGVGTGSYGATGTRGSGDEDAFC